MMRACLTLAAGLLVCGPAYAAGGVLVPTAKKSVVVLGGELVGGDHQRFKKLIKSVGLDVVFLDRPYGRSDEAVLIAAEIRNAGLNTFIAGRGGCIGTCAVLFLAGRTKYAVEGALIGIVPNGPVNSSGNQQLSIGAVLEWLGMPDAISSQMATAGDGPYWVSEAEKAQLGILTVSHNPLATDHSIVAPSPDRNLKFEAMGANARTPRPRPSPKVSSAVPVPSVILGTPTTELPGLRYLTVPEVHSASKSFGSPENSPDEWPWQAQQAADLVAAPQLEH